MQSLAERAVRIDVDTYHQVPLHTERRTELLDGRIVEMNPIGVAHRVVVTRLQQQLGELNRQGRLLIQQPLRLAQHDEPEPDVQILHGQAPLRPIEPRDVALVIEVSDSTLELDRKYKLPRYLAAALPVWIINVSDHAQPIVELYKDDAARPELEARTGRLTVVDDLTINLDELFAGLASLPQDELPLE